jgi:hypothetical protein
MQAIIFSFTGVWSDFTNTELSVRTIRHSLEYDLAYSAINTTSLCRSKRIAGLKTGALHFFPAQRHACVLAPFRFRSSDRHFANLCMTLVSEYFLHVATRRAEKIPSPGRVIEMRQRCLSYFHSRGDGLPARCRSCTPDVASLRIVVYTELRELRRLRFGAAALRADFFWVSPFLLRRFFPVPS